MTELEDADLVTILGYLSDDRSQILPAGLEYRPVEVTFRQRAQTAFLPPEARKGLEEIKTRRVSASDYLGFIAEGTAYLARPENRWYIDEMIRRMRLNGIVDMDAPQRHLLQASR